MTEELKTIVDVLDEGKEFVEKALDKAECELKKIKFPVGAMVELFRRPIQGGDQEEVTYFGYEPEQGGQLYVQRTSYKTGTDEVTREPPPRRIVESTHRGDLFAAWRRLPELRKALQKAGEREIDKLCVPPR